MKYQTTMELTETASNDGVDEDLSLVRATKNGDQCAFEQLVRKYDRPLMRIFRALFAVVSKQKT